MAGKTWTVRLACGCHEPSARVLRGTVRHCAEHGETVVVSAWKTPR